MVAALAGCGEAIDPNEPQGFIQTKGSDTMVNAVQMVSEEFMKEYPHVFVAVTGGGSGVGIASLINKTCDIASASREMKPKEIEIALKRGVNPKEIVVAYDGVAVIVNKSNPIDRLTSRGFTQDLHGKSHQLEGVRRKGPSHRDSLPGSQLGHAHVLQGGGHPTRQEGQQGGVLQRDAAVDVVAGDCRGGGRQRRPPSATWAWATCPTGPRRCGSARGKDSHPPDVENVLKKTYPLSRPLYVYTDGEPQGIVKLFVDYTLSPTGQKQFIETGFVPVGATVDREQ